MAKSKNVNTFRKKLIVAEKQLRKFLSNTIIK
jgi:hypothetical protein